MSSRRARPGFLLVLSLVMAGCLTPWGSHTGEPSIVRQRSIDANQFAFDVHAQLAVKQDNLFFSPSCIREALGLAHAGARGETAVEIARVLHLPQDAEQAQRALAHLRPRVWTGLGGVQLRQAASVWGQEGYGFQRSYLDLLSDRQAEIREIDFRDGETASRTINAWVEKQTAGKIKDLFSPGTLNNRTPLALVSAIYFKGDWVHPFPKESTRPELFYLTSDQGVRVPMMRQTESFGYAETPECQILEMPYVGKELSLIVVLPREREGLPALEKQLSAERFASWVDQLQQRKVEVLFPRFLLTASLDLSVILKNLGMTRAFTPAQADFTGMNNGKEPLHLSAAVHKAFVDVNELGTEAAAATGMAVARLSMPAETNPVFRADHPFFFAIREVRTGNLLFLGRYIRP